MAGWIRLANKKIGMLFMHVSIAFNILMFQFEFKKIESCSLFSTSEQVSAQRVIKLRIKFSGISEKGLVLFLLYWQTVLVCIVTLIKHLTFRYKTSLYSRANHCGQFNKTMFIFAGVYTIIIICHSQIHIYHNIYLSPYCNHQRQKWH